MTVSLKQYLKNFDEYMTCSPRSNDKSKDNQNNNYNNNYKFLNLLRKDDRHVPKKQNLAVLVIVATSKST